MHIEQITIGIINLVGGLLVLISYVHGILTHTANRSAMWGNVPQRIRPFYGICMLLAAAGYFAFTYFILFRLNPYKTLVANTWDITLFFWVYILILYPSALWMPLIFDMLKKPSRGLWWAIRLTLAVVGLASLGLLWALLSLNTKEPAYLYWLAVAGAVFFCIQTAVLDALVWPAFFPFRKLVQQGSASSG